MRHLAGAALLAGAAAAPLAAQVQLRLPDATHGTYSELHEGLRPGTPAADSAAQLLRETKPAVLWKRVRASLAGTAPWNDALLALTRLAQVPPGAWADSAARLERAIGRGTVRVPPAQDAGTLVEPLRAVALGVRRRRAGDAALRDELLARVPSGQYGLAEAWTLGQLGAGTGDSIAARFLAADDEALRVRWLTLLSFRQDTTLVPLLGRVFAAPDSFRVPVRYGGRASDGLMWIGTRAAFAELQSARARARARGIYADPRLARGGYGFLDNDSSLVISRTGQWIDQWLAELR